MTSEESSKRVLPHIRDPRKCLAVMADADNVLGPGDDVLSLGPSRR